VSGAWSLHGVTWLSSLTEAEREALSSASIVESHGAGAIIFEPNPHPQHVRLLEGGLVRIYRISSEGAETAFGYAAPGEILGELACFEDVARESYACAIRPSRVRKIPVESLRQLLTSRSELALAMTRQIALRFKRIESRVESLVLRDARARVAQILIELAEDFGKPREGDGVAIDIEITQAELATLVGITRQTANMYLREFEEQQVVSRSKRHLTVHRSEVLEAAVKN